jgi:predicted aspartyl protease
MDETIKARVIFGPDNAEPILGVVALEAVGLVVDPTSGKLKKLPALPLKRSA